MCFCRSNSNETISSATKPGILKFVEAAHQRQGGIYEGLKPDIKSLANHSISQLRNNYATYASPHNLKFAKRVSHTPTPIQENTACQQMINKVPDVDWPLSMLCPEATPKKFKM